MNWRYADGPARSLVPLELCDATKAQLRGLIVGGIRADLPSTSLRPRRAWSASCGPGPGTPKGRAVAFGILERLDAAEVDAVNVHGLPTTSQALRKRLRPRRIEGVLGRHQGGPGS